MMHPTATTKPTAGGQRPEPFSVTHRQGCTGFCANRAASPVRTRLDSNFRSCAANFLERRRARLHYSVIGECTTVSRAVGLAGSSCSGAIPLTMKSRHRTPRQRVAERPHETVMNNPYTHPGRPRFRTGGRKILTHDRGFSDTLQVDRSVADGSMMRTGKKHSRDVSQYATVAPILNRSVRPNLTDRSTTLSKGAADADGR